MKLYKKIIITCLVGVIVGGGVSNKDLFVSASDVGQYDSNYEDIQSVLSSSDYTSIKKINLDSDGNPESVEDIDLNAKVVFTNGVYTIDRGEGWVLKNDKGFIQSMIIPPNATGTLSKKKEISFETTVTVQTSASFGTEFLSATLKLGYGNTFGTSQYQEISKTAQAPSDKSLFVKVQGVYRRIDVVRVRDGKVIDSASTYQPISHVFSSLEFKDGETVDQSLLYETENRCILGDPLYDVKAVIDANVRYNSTTLQVNTTNGYYTLDQIERSNIPFGVYFQVGQSGKYEIRDILFATHYSYYSSYVNLGMSLYKVNANDPANVEFIKSLPYNKVWIQTSQTNFAGTPLTADLKAGETYLMVHNEAGITVWYHGEGNLANPAKYRIQFKKVG